MGKRIPKKITWADRQRIETLLMAGFTVAEIAEDIGVSRAAIYYEMERGGVPYCADRAQKNVGGGRA